MKKTKGRQGIRAKMKGREGKTGGTQKDAVTGWTGSLENIIKGSIELVHK